MRVLLDRLHKDLHLKELFIGTSKAFIVKCLGVLLQFLLGVVIARYLGASGAGLFFLALTIANVCNGLSRFGTDNPIVRFTAAELAGNDWGRVRGLYVSVHVLVIVTALIMAVFIFAFAPFLAHTLFDQPELQQLLKLFALLIPANAIFMANAQFLKGAKRIISSQFVESVFLPLSALLMLTVIAIGGDVFSVAMIYVLSAWFSVLGGIFLWRLTPKRGTEKVKFPFKKLIESSSPLFVSSMANIIIMWLATIILGMYAEPADVGRYSLALRTSMLLAFFIFALNNVAGPKIAESFRNNDLGAVEQIARQSSILMTFLSLPVFLIFMIWPDWVMSLFGGDFTSGGDLLRIMACGQFVNVITGPVGLTLMMVGEERVYKNMLVYSALLNAVICLLTIPYFGAIAAAGISAFTVIILNGGFVVLVRLKLEISPLPFMSRCNVRPDRS